MAGAAEGRIALCGSLVLNTKGLAFFHCNTIKEQWTSHGQKVKDCYSIWLAAIDPDTPALGEIKTDLQIYQNQIASTIVKLLGHRFNNGKEIGDPMETIVE